MGSLCALLAAGANQLLRLTLQRCRRFQQRLHSRVAAALDRRHRLGDRGVRRQSERRRDRRRNRRASRSDIDLEIESFRNRLDVGNAHIPIVDKTPELADRYARASS